MYINYIYIEKAIIYKSYVLDNYIYHALRFLIPSLGRSPNFWLRQILAKDNTDPARQIIVAAAEETCWDPQFSR